MYRFAFDPSPTCPRNATGAPVSECSNICFGSGAAFLCTTDTDCKGVGHCAPLQVTPVGNNSMFVVGACVP